MRSYECYWYVFVAVIRAFWIYVSKDVKIRGYFGAPKEIREKNSFGNHCYT
jgi:hypothetical protein